MATTTRSVRPHRPSGPIECERLFDGPTMIKVAPPTRTRGMFKEIYRAVRPGSPHYPIYVESKEHSKTLYDHKFRNEKYVSDMSVVEPHDKNSVIVFSLNRLKRVTSTLRLCLDEGAGIPMADDIPDVIEELRQQGKTIAEPGRFTNSAGERISRCLISAAYEIACYSRIDVYLMQCRADHSDFYKSHLGAEVLEKHRAPESCVNMIWRIADTPKIFFYLFGRNRSALERLIYQSENLNG